MGIIAAVVVGPSPGTGQCQGRPMGTRNMRRISQVFTCSPTFAGVYSIHIVSIIRAESCVEIFADLRRRTNCQIGIECLIQHSRPFLWRHLDVCVEMANLTKRVRPTIRAARAYNLHILASCLANSLCQSALDSSLPSLRGPAAKIGTVVGDGQSDPFSRQAPTRRSERHRPGACPSW